MGEIVGSISPFGRFSVSKFFILLAICVFDKIAENMKRQKPGNFLRKVLF